MKKIILVAMTIFSIISVSYGYKLNQINSFTAQSFPESVLILSS